MTRHKKQSVKIDRDTFAAAFWAATVLKAAPDTDGWNYVGLEFEQFQR